MRCDREDAHEEHSAEGFDDNNCSVSFTCKGVSVPAPGQAALIVNSVPDNHLIVGHLTYLKLLDEDGDDYWGVRTAGMNVMESIGCAADLLDECKSAVRRLPTDRGDEIG